MQHHCWETNAFSKMPFSIGNYMCLCFFGKELLHYKPQYPLKCCRFAFLRHMLHYKIQHSWSVAACFFRNIWLFQNYCFNWKLHSSLISLGKELFNNKTQYPLKSCDIAFGSFEKCMPFSRCLLQLGNALLLKTR